MIGAVIVHRWSLPDADAVLLGGDGPGEVVLVDPGVTAERLRLIEQFVARRADLRSAGTGGHAAVVVNGSRHRPAREPH